MEFVIISGLSGAGKSRAASAMEDMGFYVVDNLPAPLIPRFAELCMAGGMKYDRVALVTDVRSGQTFDGLFEALNALEGMGCQYKILFMEADPQTVIARYKETRRIHPMAQNGRTLQEAVAQEARILEPVRARAAYIVDTSGFTPAQLRGEILRLFRTGSAAGCMRVNVISFGFKHGIPLDADLVFDVRFLPNPYYIAELREHTGLEENVRSFVFSYQQTRDFMGHLEHMIGFLLPQYVEEGKTVLEVAVGCTGGQHRSVALAHALAEFIRQKGYPATENHRDMKA